MALNRHKLREIVFHLLYSNDFAMSAREESFPFLMQHHQVSKKSVFEAEAEAEAVQAHLPEIDKMIAETATDYEFARIPRVERNLLRLGVYEILFGKIPPKVAISEAIRLTKKFSSSESVHFVNAILDALYKKNCS